MSAYLCCTTYIFMFKRQSTPAQQHKYRVIQYKIRAKPTKQYFTEQDIKVA